MCLDLKQLEKNKTHVAGFSTLQEANEISSVVNRNGNMIVSA